MPRESDYFKDFDDKMAIDWRSALRSPPTYRIGNGRVRVQTKFVWMTLGLSILVIFFLFYGKGTKDDIVYTQSTWPSSLKSSKYNFTYPLSTPIQSNGLITFRIGLIADLDTNSKCTETGNCWKSYFKKGYLSYNKRSNSVVVTWDSTQPAELTSGYSLKGRGMELSELTVFNGRLLSFDDRTGMVFEILGDKAIPWLLLMDGDGQKSKGFKSEWATVKGNFLYVGSMGKEWTTDIGKFQSNDPQWVKIINIAGEVHHESWINQYKAVRAAIGIEWPGYMIHEAVSWSDVHQKWFFLPRRCSKERYNDTRDEHMGCNVIITADEAFMNIQVTEIKTKHIPTFGFSSFKFIPGSNDEILVALQSEELNGSTSTSIMAFDIHGNVVMPKSKVSDLKYEGLEFI